MSNVLSTEQRLRKAEADIIKLADALRKSIGDMQKVLAEVESGYVSNVSAVKSNFKPTWTRFDKLSIGVKFRTAGSDVKYAKASDRTAMILDNSLRKVRFSDDTNVYPL